MKDKIYKIGEWDYYAEGAKLNRKPSGKSSSLSKTLKDYHLVEKTKDYGDIVDIQYRGVGLTIEFQNKKIIKTDLLGNINMNF